MKHPFVVLACATLLATSDVSADVATVIVRPVEIDDVLTNPGIGFTTFLRYNGDALNPGVSWSEHYDETALVKNTKLTPNDYPLSTIAYVRFHWKDLEPEPGKVRWELIDRALARAREHGQTLMVRLMPYTKRKNEDVPAWYREMAKDPAGKKYPDDSWLIDHANPEYLKRWTSLIREFGRRYDGSPDIESVDISMVGSCGEGDGIAEIPEGVRQDLLNAYLGTFKKTILAVQPPDLIGAKERAEGAPPPVGWRVDCLGELGEWSPEWNHMQDIYPQTIIHSGLRDAWMFHPVEMEACDVLQSWKDKKWDIDYIIEQSLKWHISSFNNKSSRIPPAWRKKIEGWLNKMGYRLVLRKLRYPKSVSPGGKVIVNSWWENKGVAPPYHEYKVGFRLKGPRRSALLLAAADVRTWLPGDALLEEALPVPENLESGKYEFEVGVIDPVSHEPRVQLAIAGRTADGWYPLGQIDVVK